MDKKFQLTDEQMVQLSIVNGKINAASTQFVGATFQLRGLEGSLAQLFLNRKNTMEKMAADKLGVDVGDIVNIELNQQGEAKVILKDPESESK